MVSGKILSSRVPPPAVRDDNIWAAQPRGQRLQTGLCHGYPLKKPLLYPAPACATVTGHPPPPSVLGETPKQPFLAGVAPTGSFSPPSARRSRGQEMQTGSKSVKTQEEERCRRRLLRHHRTQGQRFCGSAHGKLHPFYFHKRNRRLLIPTGDLGWI